MPGCGMHSRPKLAEKARYNGLLKIKSTITRYLKLKLYTSQRFHVWLRVKRSNLFSYCFSLITGSSSAVETSDCIQN